jgi:hypothetical protein
MNRPEPLGTAPTLGGRVRWPRRSAAASGATGEGSRESWQTALKTAYFIGEPAREVFFHVAASRSKELRKTATYALYLLWRTDCAFVFGLLDEMAQRLHLRHPVRSLRTLRFAGDLSITIYINNPEQPEVVMRTARLWKVVAKEKARLDRRPWLGFIAYVLVASIFSRRVVNTSLLAELQPPRLFFHAPRAQRAAFDRAASLVEPRSLLDAEPALSDLRTLLHSEVLLHNVLAALILAIHGTQDFEANEPLLRRLFDELDGHGRLWELQAFSVLLPNTPPEWVPMLETFTESLVGRDRATLLSYDDRRMEKLDAALLSLGLAYGKRRMGMPAFERLISSAVRSNDVQLVQRLVEGLAPVGFHYPESVFMLLRPHMSELAHGPSRTPLAATLSTMRTIRFDSVDVFLSEAGADIAFRKMVVEGTSVDRVRRIVAFVGFYNNAVHQALNYPLMRRGILEKALEDLSRARTPLGFIVRYTRSPMRMFRKADYDLTRWTTAE